MSFYFKDYNERKYLINSEFNDTGLIKHCFTTRAGGLSTMPEGLNLSFTVNDKRESVLQNYKLVAQDFKFSYDNMVLTHQTHSTNIRIISSDDAGKGISKPSDIVDTDGLITNIPNIPLVIFFADCVPLLFLDPKNRIIAASHSGWKGTANKIGAKTVALMQQKFNCNPSDIIVAIGPSIGPCCFETESDAAQYFEPQYVTSKGHDKFIVDLWKATIGQLIESGVSENNIFLSNECTKCNGEIFYSYRVEEEKAGRMAAIIELM